MSSDPTISVVIPAYNAADYLPETLQSVFAQSYPVHEVIVVNDGSTDHTDRVLQSFGGRIRQVYQENAGEGASRNVGIEHASGDWIAFLDADDLWSPQKLEEQVCVLQRHPQCVCVHTDFYKFGAGHKSCGQGTCSAIGHPVYDMDTLIGEALVLPSSAIVRRRAPTRFLSWKIISIDMIYFAELSELGRFVCVPKKLVGYRQHMRSMTKQPGNWIYSIECRLRWINESDKFTVERREQLKRRLFQSVVDQTYWARWRRDWVRYWVLREYLKRSWPWPKERAPDVTRERIYPRIAYRIKDCVDALGMRMGGR
jgi:glycosyltransferase involved in cell wall biosynthesis